MILEASGLLFDNDGVLVNSMASVEGSWGVWAKNYSPGFELTYEYQGQRASEIVAQLVGEAEFDEALESEADIVIQSLEGISFKDGKLEIPNSRRLR